MNGAGAARVTWEVVNHGRGEDALSMKMGAVFSSETLVYFCKTIRCHGLGDSTLNTT